MIFCMWDERTKKATRTKWLTQLAASGSLRWARDDVRLTHAKNVFPPLFKWSSWQKGLSPRVRILSTVEILYSSFLYHLYNMHAAIRLLALPFYYATVVAIDRLMDINWYSFSPLLSLSIALDFIVRVYYDTSERNEKSPTSILANSRIHWNCIVWMLYIFTNNTLAWIARNWTPGIKCQKQILRTLHSSMKNGLGNQP